LLRVIEKLVRNREDFERLSKKALRRRLLGQRLHLEIVFVQATLRLLLPSPPPSSLVFPFIYLPRAVPVADTAVPLVEELISWDGIFLDVPIDKREVPGEERVELE
jgi:hypothetical protein